MEEIQVSIPSKITAGNTITPEITGMIPDSKNKASEIFKGKWDLNGNIKETGISYKVPVNTEDKSGIKLELILNEQYGAVKQNMQNPNYVNVQKSTSWSNECKIEKKTLETIITEMTKIREKVKLLRFEHFQELLRV